MFCPKCGNALNDDAKFCAACGTSLATQATAPAEPVMAPQYSAPAEPVTSPQYSAPAEPVAAPQYSAPMQNTVAPQYSAPMQNTAAPQYSNVQQTFQNGMPGDNSQWGPLMQPQKKSKAPLFIGLGVGALIIAIAVVVIVLLCCGGSGDGADSAEDALTAAIDAVSEQDYDTYVSCLPGESKIVMDATLELADYLASMGASSTTAEELMAELSPTGEDFKYSDLKIKDEHEYDDDELDELNEETIEDLEEVLEQYEAIEASAALSGYDFEFDTDLSSVEPEDYVADAAVDYEGTIEIDGDEYTFEATIIEIDGGWYVKALKID